MKSSRSIIVYIYIVAHGNMALKGYEVIVLMAHMSSNTGNHAYLDRWLQHLQSGNSHEYQVGYYDSSQVWSQSQYRLPGQEEWLQFPGQSKHGTGQLHLWNHFTLKPIEWGGTLTHNHNYYIISHLEMKTQLKSLIWWRLEEECGSHSNVTFVHKSCIQLYMYLLIKIPALYRQPLHQKYSRSHHRQFPTHYCCKFLLGPHNCLCYLEAWCLH